MTGVSLVDLAVKYFSMGGYKTERDVVLEGFSGLTWKFDLLIQKGREKHLVLVKDWKRTVGINVVIKVDKAAADVGLPQPIIISNKFSGHAKAYANRRGVTLLTKRQVLRRIR